MAGTATLLLVDDNEDSRDLLAELLTGDGRRVVTAENGAIALEKLRVMPGRCVVLLDLMMPVMNGWQFVEAVRADAALAQVPILVISAFGSHLPLPEGVQGLLPKPLDLDALREAIDRF